MGKVQSHMVEKVNQAFTDERKAQIKKSFLYCKERACVFKEVTLLTRSSFQNAISDLNSMLEKSSGEKVLFHSKVPDRLDWKKSIRILCIQVDQYNSDPVVTRFMNIIQFWTLRSEIIRQFGGKSICDEENNFQFVDNEGELINPNEEPNIVQSDHEVTGLSSAQILERANELSMEDVECCICMDNKSDVSLACAHSFCKECIDTWARPRTGEQRTCPQCRAVIKAEDEYWVMADVPDREEMRDYIASLASGL
ncbi:RING finger protein 141-like [Rhopilema esculentum]|uniref:RING finger protein 141-like n=1 Tax=Rhopilema esculentum TaxID=499914 RepID=UPI0031D798F7